MKKHTTHFDDCGCLSERHDVFVKDLKKEMAERLAIIEDLRKKNAALLEAAYKTERMIEDNFLKSVTARKALAAVKTAIAQAEEKP